MLTSYLNTIIIIRNTHFFIIYYLALVKFQRDLNGIPDVICATLNVLGATYANCDGRYQVTGESVEWAPERPVYRHVSKDRFVFWNAHGLGWSIGKEEYLTSGSHWHRSKFKTKLKPYFYTDFCPRKISST